MPDLAAARATFLTDFRAALDQALSWPTTPKPLVLVSAPGGIGKTRAATHFLRGNRVTWFGERNEMLGQLETFLKTPLPGVSPLTGPSSFVPTIEKRLARNDEGACSQYPYRVAPLLMKNLGRYTESMACRVCPDRSACVYQNWKPSKEWLFAPHVWLGLGVDHKHLFAGRDIVVIDESPMSEMLDGVTLVKWELQLLLNELRRVSTTSPSALGATAFVALFEQALDLLANPPPGRARIELRRLAEDLGFHFTSRVWSLTTMRTWQPSIPGLSTVDPWQVARTTEALARAPAELRAKLPRVADALAADGQKRPACVLVLPDSSTKSGGGIAAGHFKPLPVPETLPLVVLDATADESRYWCLMRPSPQTIHTRPIIRVDVEADQESKIWQTVDHRYPAATLGHPQSNTIQRLMEIVDLYKADSPTHRCAVVVKKQLYVNNDAFKKRVDQSFTNVDDIKFFWALRGDNSLENYDAIFIVGAPELDSLEAEARVRAYMTRLDPLPDEEPYDYNVVSRTVASQPAAPLEDEHGRPVKLEERGYEGREQYVAWRLLYQDEFVQAILRARPFDPARKKNVFFFSNALLTVLDVTYIREDELLRKDCLVLAKQVLDAWRRAGNSGRLTQRRLAALMGLDESTISQAKKKDPESWALLLAAMGGSAET